MHRTVRLLLLIAGTSFPAIAASGPASAVDLPVTTTTTAATTSTTASTTTTTAPGETATDDVGSTTTTTTAPGETATDEVSGTTEGGLDVLSGGGLSISVPGAVDLSPGTPISAGGLSGALGPVTVSDSRGGLVAGWTATVSATDFVAGGGSAHETIPSANVSYWSGPATATTGSGTFGPGQPAAANAQPMATQIIAFSALTTVGDSSATWSPTVVVSIPRGVVAGQYQGTITHSVA